MFKAINLLRLRNAEYIQLLTDTLTLAGETLPPASPVDTQVTALHNKLDAISAIFQPDRASALTDDIVALDDRRDEAYTGMGMVARGFAHHHDAAKREAGQTLSRVFDVYGEVTLQAYQGETARITGLLTDFSARPELAAAIITLDLTDWVTELATANTQFSAMYIQRSNTVADARTDNTIKALRLEANKAWKALRDKIGGYYAVSDGAAPWSTLVARFNELIDQYNTLLAARAGRKGKDDDAFSGDMPA